MLVALPGLINLHGHLDMDGSADFMTSALGLTEQTGALLGAHSAREALHAGITTLRDLGTKYATAISVRDAVEKGWINGPRIVAAGKVVCMTGGHCWFLGREADGPHEIRKAVRENLRAGADCIKVIATGGVLSAGVEPGNTQLDQDELDVAVREAHKAGRRVAAHAIGTAGIHNALRAGVDTVEHGCYLDDAALALFKSSSATYVPTLAAPYCLYRHLAELPDYAARKTREVYEAHRESFRRAIRAGVPIAAGADSGTPFNYHSAFAIELECMVELGMSAEQALATTGRNAAAALNRKTEIGTLEEGKVADVVFLADDPRRDIRALRDVKAVVARGRLHRVKR
jgi:imidazolonepropionase-like amidohydrolase